MLTMQTIATHNGKFHCDEVLACFMLKQLPKFENHAIIRTRDPSILASCDIVVDVGAVYDPFNKRFDHHQETFHDTMNTLLNMEYNTRLSSAGLIYAHYGKEVIAKILNIDFSNSAVSLLYEKMYECFVESVDAIDNGIQQFDGSPRYRLSSTLNSRVDYLNPVWNEKNQKPDFQFKKAMQIVGEEFTDRVKYFYNSWLPAREFVQKAIETRKEFHSSGKILLITPEGVPWKEHFFKLEKDLDLNKADICLVVYEDTTNKTWRVQAIPVSKTSGFENRILLPWSGLRDDKLEKESGVPGAIFVHVNGFTGGAKTRESVIMIAIEALYRAGKIKKKLKKN